MQSRHCFTWSMSSFKTHNTLLFWTAISTWTATASATQSTTRVAAVPTLFTSTGPGDKKKHTQPFNYRPQSIHSRRKRHTDHDRRHKLNRLWQTGRLHVQHRFNDRTRHHREWLWSIVFTLHHGWRPSGGPLHIIRQRCTDGPDSTGQQTKWPHHAKENNNRHQTANNYAVTCPRAAKSGKEDKY